MYKLKFFENEVPTVLKNYRRKLQHWQTNMYCFNLASYHLFSCMPSSTSTKTHLFSSKEA